MEAIRDHIPIRIKHLEQKPLVPNLFEQDDGRSIFETGNDGDAFSVYSDPFGYYPVTGRDQLNLSNEIGNLGAASLLCGIAFAQSHLSTRKGVAAVCRDRDVYGREACVELEAE